MGEANYMRTYGVRGVIPTDVVEIQKYSIKLEEIFFTDTPLAAGASVSTPKIYRLDYNRLTILIGADKVGKFIIKPYNYRGTLLPTEFVGDVAVEVINYKYDISANYVILTYENGAVAQTKFAFLVEGEIV